MFNFQHIRSYRGGQFYWRRKPEFQEETADLRQVTYKKKKKKTKKKINIFLDWIDWCFSTFNIMSFLVIS